MNKTYVVVALVGLIIAGSALWYGSQRSHSDSEEAAGGALSLGNLSGINLTDLAGEPVELSDYAGKPLVVNAWATWCPFCIEELPAFVDVQDELGESVTIIAIDRGESASTATEFIDQLDLGDELVMLLDPSDSFYAKVGGFSMPETLFFNSDGTLGFHKRGPMDTIEIKQRITSLK